jgi:hypothetical protein
MAPHMNARALRIRHWCLVVMSNIMIIKATSGSPCDNICANCFDSLLGRFCLAHLNSGTLSHRTSAAGFCYAGGNAEKLVSGAI